METVLEGQKQMNLGLLGEQIQAAFGHQPFRMQYDHATYAYALVVPDGVDPVQVQAVLDAHDHTQLSQRQQDEAAVSAARTGIQNIPEWALWSAEEAASQVTGRVFNGMSKAQANAWIDENVDGTTVAALRTQTIAALKVVAGAIIDQREMTANVARMLAWLRDLEMKQ